VIRKIFRFEELNVDGGSVRVEDDARIPEFGTPSFFKQLTTDGALDPAPR
jgi:hypothetical protein